MCESRLALNDYVGGIKDIESFLLQNPKNFHFLIKKVRVVIDWQ